MAADAQIVVVWPFWSQSNALNWDSNWNYLRTVLPELSRQRPAWVFVVMWPLSTASSRWKWYDEGVFDALRGRVIRFGWPYASAVRAGVLSFDSERFKTLDTDLAPSVYWMHQVESAWAIADGYDQTFSVANQPYVIAQHHYVAHKSLPYSTQFTRLWAQIGGSLAADRVILNSRYTDWMMRDAFAPYLADAQLAEIVGKSTTELLGLVGPELRDQPVRRPEPDEPALIIWNHRFEVFKGPDETAAAIKALRDEGRKFRVLTTVAQAQNVSTFPFDEAKVTPDHRRYLANIAVPHINTVNSVYETFNLSMLDTIALGGLPVAPNRLTFPELLPKDYPYLFNSRNDQIAMLRSIIDSWPKEWEHWHERLRAHAAATFGLEEYVARYAEILTPPSLQAAKPHNERAFKLALGGLKAGRYAIPQLASALRKATRQGSQSVSNRRTARLAAHYGATFEVAGDRILINWPGLPKA